MNECSNCGQIVGHMYSDYYKLSKQLSTELSTTNPLSMWFAQTPYNTVYNDDLTPFIKTYYMWYEREQQKVANDPKYKLQEYSPYSIIARALLRSVELEPQHLPFGSVKEDDGTISHNAPRQCCMRMLVTDPGATSL